MQFVAGPHRTRPAQLLEADAENAAGRPELAVDHQSHGHRGGVPAACGETLKRRFLCRLLVDVERLRIELPRKSENLLFVDTQPAGVENLARREILQIAHGHLRGSSCERRTGRSLRPLNHTPLATAAALIKPNAASATAKAMKTSVRLPPQRKASQPPPVAITRRAILASNGHSRRPAPCEAKYSAMPRPNRP